MPTVQQLNTVTSITSSDYLPVFISQYGDTYKASAAVIRTYMNELDPTAPTADVTQYASPTTVSTLTLTTGANLWVILTPAVQYLSNLTLILPNGSTTTHGTVVRIYCTTPIVNIAYTLNGAIATIGLPADRSANHPFAFKFDSITRNWYLI